MDANNKQTYLRFFHGFPSNVAVDLYLGDRKIASGLTFGGFTPYTAVDPRYTMDVQLTNGEKRVLWVPNINLRQGRYYSIYMIGQGKEGETEFPLIAVIPLDGNSYL